MQVGCDPKRDSIATLCGGLQPTILSAVEQGDIDEETMRGLIREGYNGILGVESGGPKPGSGCAGRGVLTALRILEEYDIFEKYDITFALFDVLGDVVCGGFAQPLRAGYAREVYIVTCGELLTLLQINNIAASVRRLNEQGADCAVAGLINNMRGVENEEQIVEAVAERMGVPVIAHIPRSPLVQEAEMDAKTVVGAFPDSDQAEVYRELARKVLDNQKTYIPNTISFKEIRPIVSQYASRKKTEV